jgi:hypothetical protein
MAAELLALPQAHTRTRAVASTERVRRRIVFMVMLIYMLLIFEGSIRKWLLPQFASYIFFIRDPFVLYVYFLAFHYRLWPKRQPMLWVIVAMGAIGLLIGLAGILTSTSPTDAIIVAVYGWRNYFLYAPLAFIVGTQLSLDDLRRIYRWTLVLAAPIGALVAVQFASPPGAPINVGTATDAALQFAGIGLDPEHTRPMSTFSSVAAHTQFVASTFAILLGLMILRGRERGVALWRLVLGAAGVATCLALGGNRGALLGCAVIAIAGMSLAVVGRTAAVRLRAIALPVFVAIAFAVLFPVLFPEGFETFAWRWQAAAAAESDVGGIYGRALYGFVDFIHLIGDAPLLGYGLGLGGNAAITLGLEGSSGPLPYVESDWGRHIVDLGPVFGPAYIVLRIALTIWLGLVALKAVRRGAGPLPLLLYAYVALVLLNGQITGQGGINGYAWLFTGLTLAAAAARPTLGVRKRPRTRFAERWMRRAAGASRGASR